MLRPYSDSEIGTHNVDLIHAHTGDRTLSPECYGQKATRLSLPVHQVAYQNSAQWASVHIVSAAYPSIEDRRAAVPPTVTQTCRSTTTPQSRSKNIEPSFQIICLPRRRQHLTPRRWKQDTASLLNDVYFEPFVVIARRQQIKADETSELNRGGGVMILLGRCSCLRL